MEIFKIQFAQKYYPDKVHLLRQQSFEPKDTLPFATESRTAPRSIKKCPYCAEDILFEARVCRFCGGDLTQEHPDVIKSKRKTLYTKLATLEKNLAGQEMSLQKWQQVAQKEAREANQSEIVFVIGLLLAPIGIGIILLISSGLTYFSHKGNRNNAESNQTKIRSNIERLRKEITEVKIDLANLG